MQKELPIYGIENEIISNVCQPTLAREAREQAGKNNRLIVQAPTGSGKSTQIPQMILEHGLAGDGQIVILQPRRIAARMLAARVAQERNQRLGDEVGYQIRFEDVTSKQTRIKYVTEGILLRQLLVNPELRGISVVLFDEFHERHLYGDISLARVLNLQEKSRPDLKILVMSATLSTELLEPYLKPCATLSSEGRTYPVTIEYIDHAMDLPVWDEAVEAFENAMAQNAPGDVLIFMPGAYEISRTIQALRGSSAAKGFIILPLHGELNSRDQDAAVNRYEQRKVIVATNVAETSLTIDGIRVVIDGGLARIPKYDPYRGINTLLIEKISRASADQRAGRAGRTAPGHCIRLWTEKEHQQRALQELPEIKRLDLSEVILTLKASGVNDLREFRWLEPPEPRSLDRAELLLKDLGALDYETGAITDLGRRMLSFPMHPRYSRMLLAAEQFGCVYQTALIASLTQGRDLLIRQHGKDVAEKRKDFFGEEAVSDFFILMRAWNYADKNGYDLNRCKMLGIHAQSARQVRPLFEYFLKIAKEEGLRVEPRPMADEAVQKAILTGFSDQLACRLDTGTLRCQLVHNRKGVLARDSVVQHSPLIVAGEVHEIEGRDKELNVLLTLATAVKAEWLQELFPNDFKEKVAVHYDNISKRVVAEQQHLFRDLPLQRKTLDAPPLDAAADILAQEVIGGKLTLKNWDASVEQWIMRVNCLAQWMPELNLPIIDAAAQQTMIQQICHGAISYKDIKEREVWSTVKNWLNPEQLRLLEKHAPERLELSNGRRAKLTYAPEKSPHIALRIQELFGVNETPRIAGKRVPVLIHILAPNQRPVQITQDLAGFWKEHYPSVKKEMQRKYPKHEWR